MAFEEWIKSGTKYCNFVGTEVELMEKRVYPTGIQDHNGKTYRVLRRKCSAAYQCGDRENRCVWAEVGGDGRLYMR